MGVLANPDHERACQLAHKRIWGGESKSDALHAVYVDVIYDGEEPQSEATKANVRKFFNRAEIKKRMAELSEYAAKLAGIDASWALLRAKRMVEFDAQKFIDGKCDLSDLPGDVEIVESEAEGDEKPTRSLFKTKIKASDRLGALALMAKIAGWLAPEKQEHSGGLTLEQLVTNSMKPKERAGA
jgi:hypothetical protein